MIFELYPDLDAQKDEPWRHQLSKRSRETRATPPIPYAEPVTYLHVTLNDGENWSFQPSAGQPVAWLAVNRGALGLDGTLFECEMLVFEEGTGAIDLQAIGATEFVIGRRAIMHIRSSAGTTQCTRA